MKMTRIRILILLVLLGGALSISPPHAALAFEVGECLDCHGDQALTSTKDGQEVSLYVDGDVYASSIHGANGLACDECHTDATEIPHGALAPVDCSSCHDEAAAAFGKSIHADSASCSDCHGSHSILPAEDPRSRVYPLAIPEVCGRCHSDPAMVGEEAAVYNDYQAGQHGMATAKGLVGAAVCTDCHGSHEILPTDDPASLANRRNITATCGQCHRGAVTALGASVHGEVTAAQPEEGPVCTNCHSGHMTLRTDKEVFRLEMVETCGGCHHEPFETYRASYHGQITGLGFPDMATCVACHGSHDVLRVANPASLVSEENRLQTCRQCHPKATENFTGFAPHLDHGNWEKFPVESGIFSVMSSLVFGVFLFFGAHTLLWFIRGMFEKVRHEGPPHLGNPTGRYFIRINYYHRVTHFLIFTSFVLLALTGLPLKFSHTAWAKVIAAGFGGFQVAGAIHRLMGVVTFAYFGLHLGFLAYLAISGRMKVREMIWGPKSIVPQPNDAVDLANMFKWFLGLGPKPRLGRFTYWEKFDYLAVFRGVAVIGLSGLVLWLPEFFTRLLPGIAINIAWIIHADEALLATGFIFLIHFFNTHLRVEKFPLDPVILTGRISEEEMRHERPLEFAIRRQDGSLREIQTTPPPLWMRNFSRAVGWVFVFIGFGLLVAMLSGFFV